jgi:hypothetical protein
MLLLLLLPPLLLPPLLLLLLPLGLNTKVGYCTGHTNRGLQQVCR